MSLEQGNKSSNPILAKYKMTMEEFDACPREMRDYMNYASFRCSFRPSKVSLYLSIPPAQQQQAQAKWWKNDAEGVAICYAQTEAHIASVTAARDGKRIRDSFLAKRLTKTTKRGKIILTRPPTLGDL